MNFPTEEVQSQLLKIKSLEELRRFNNLNYSHPEPLDYFESLLKARNIKFSTAFKLASIEESYGRHIKNKSRKLNRNTIIKLALGINLTLDETQAFLKYAELNTLYSKNPRDQFIIYAINAKMTVIKANLELTKLHFDLL